MFNEIYKLIGMLTFNKIPFNWGELYEGFWVTLLGDDGVALDQCLCHKYSHGFEQGKIEDSHAEVKTASEVYNKWVEIYELDKENLKNFFEKPLDKSNQM